MLNWCSNALYNNTPKPILSWLLIKNISFFNYWESFLRKQLLLKDVIKQVLQQISEEHNNITTNGTDNSQNNIDDDNISFKNK